MVPLRLQFFSGLSRRENYKDKWDEHCATTGDHLPTGTQRSDRLSEQSWEGLRQTAADPGRCRLPAAWPGLPPCVRWGRCQELVALDFPFGPQ